MCDNFKKVQRLLDQKPDLDVLKLIIVAEETIPENIAAKATEVGVELVTFQQMTDLGKENLKDATVCNYYYYNLHFNSICSAYFSLGIAKVYVPHGPSIIPQTIPLRMNYYNVSALSFNTLAKVLIQS